jgi:hypothetical protein
VTGQKLHMPSQRPADDSAVSVRVLLASGGQRIVETADGAVASGEFFIVTRRSTPGGSNETLLTVRAQDVVGAEIIVDGVVTGYVAGKGKAST